MLKDYFFGKVDGAREVNHDNYDIDKYYYNQGINLMRDDILIVFGRKGSGKTYIAQKAINDAQNGAYNAYIIKYAEIKGKMLALNIIKPNALDWKRVLNIIVLEKIANDNVNIDIPEEFISNFPFHVKVKKNVPSALKNAIKEADFSVGPFSVNLREKGMESSSYLFSKLEIMVENLNLDKTNLFIFDEFDELLFSKEGRDSLAVFIECLNDYGVRNIKPIILLRDDKIILSGAGQKILTDCAVTINWSKEALCNMLKKRLDANNTNLAELFDKWIKVCNYDINTIETIHFWDYIVDYTFYRPRDIIAFMNQCIKDFPKKNHISNSDLKKVIRSYSKKYFFDNLLDELTIYFQNNNIEDTQAMIKPLCEKLCDAPVDESLNTRYWNFLRGFSYRDFYKAAEEFLSEQYNTPKNIKELFRHLLRIGCIGQLKRKGDAPGTGGILRWVFSYEDEDVDLLESGRYILHKAVRYQFIEEYLPGGEQ